MRSALDIICRENKKHNFYSTNFFRKSCHLLDNVEEKGKAGPATDVPCALHAE